MRPFSDEEKEEHEHELERLARLPKCCDKPMRKICEVPIPWDLSSSFELWQCQGDCKQVREDQEYFGVVEKVNGEYVRKKVVF